MFNFIICDDNKIVRKLHEDFISKIAMPYDFDYKITSLEKYDSKFKSVINDNSDFKVYILDLELPDKSGIDIAREIRKTDWESIIIIITSHDELELKLFKEKLLIYEFISKFDNYEEQLAESIKTIINKKRLNNVISFKSNRQMHNVKYENIIYICKDNSSDKVKIKTIEKEYLVRDSLINIANKLDNTFYQTHRCFYVNLNNIDSVDFKEGSITFVNGETVDYLSRSYKKGLREKL